MPYTFRHGDRPLEGMTVQRAVGRGGFGEVYYTLTDSGKQVALKYLRENPEIELRGIAQVMNLKSPHLITIYDVRRNGGNEPFVLMEYVSGPSLRELLLNAPDGLGPQKAAYFIDGIAKGLAYLHDRGIVHRDLKPANIFYDDGYVKIGDYGLSKHISVSRHSGQTVSVGTVHYMAPEIGSGSYTKAIDIYAMGVILYEMLTGRLPFSGSSMGEILMRHLSDRPDLAGIPEPFAAVIAKALAKDPRDRYQDANEMADALRQFADVSASIASFDHSTLNNVPRRDDANDAEQTRTTPHRVPPPPPMDVWAPPPGRADVLSEKLQKKMERISRKFQHKADKLARRRGMHGARRMRWSPELEPALNPRAARTNRLAQLFIILALMVGVATGLSFIRGGPRWDEVAAGLFCCLMASVAGPLVVYFRLLRRSPVQRGLWDRLAYVAITAVMLIPAFGMASDFVTAAAWHRPAALSALDKRGLLDEALQVVIEDDGVRAPSAPRLRGIRDRWRSGSLTGGQVAARYVQADGRFMNMLIAPLAMLFFCDWTRRIRTGQMGQVRARDAVWPGLVGLIAASIAGADSFELPAFAVCATASLLTQAGAAICPAKPRAAEADDAQPAHSALDAAGVRNVPDHAARSPIAPSDAREAPGANAPANPPESSTNLPPPIVIDASPSIFGRLVNTGIAFTAKVLLVLGLALAVGHDAFQQRVRAAVSEGTAGAAVAGAANHLPARAVLVIPLLGALLLVFSRRHDGGMHLLRGCVGGALGLGAAVMALGPAADALAALFASDHWAALDWGQLGAPLALTAATLLASILLLTWPRRQRQSDTIVV